MPHPLPRFLLTENLNKLAKWLRILGYDAAVYKRISHQRQINLAIKERRVLLTRDKKTANSALKFQRLLIRENDPVKQLQEVMSLLKFEPEQLFSRCLNCNKLLREIEKEKIKTLLPEYVYENFREFKLCPRCGRIFWKGSHYMSMKQKLDELFPS